MPRIDVPPSTSTVKSPVAPQDPPTSDDIYNARQYVDDADLAYRHFSMSKGEFAEIIMYEAKVQAAKLSTEGDVFNPPPWLRQAMQTFKDEITGVIQVEITGIKTEITGIKNEIIGIKNEIKNEVNGIKNEITGIKNDVNVIKNDIKSLQASNTVLEKRLLSTQRTGAQAYNIMARGGKEFEYQIVPLPDGTDPVINHKLPQLRNGESISKLTDAQVKTYHTLYLSQAHTNRVREREAQIANICKAIGAGPI